MGETYHTNKKTRQKQNERIVLFYFFLTTRNYTRRSRGRLHDLYIYELQSFYLTIARARRVRTGFLSEPAAVFLARALVSYRTLKFFLQTSNTFITDRYTLLSTFLFHSLFSSSLARPRGHPRIL